MPMRAYRAATASAGEHLSTNMWRWIIISAVVTAVLCGLYWMIPDFQLLAHLMAIAGMVCGTLVMMQSQLDYVSPHAPKDEEEEVVTPPVPRA